MSCGAKTKQSFIFSKHVEVAVKGPQVVIQRNPYGVRVLGREACSKHKRQSPPASPSGSSINVPSTRLERRMEAAQSIRTRDQGTHSRVNHHQLLLGNWNILTLTGKELELVEKAKRYHLDIIGVSSTKRRGSGSVDLDGGWKLFYSGADPSMSAQAGVGIRTCWNRHRYVEGCDRKTWSHWTE